MTIMHTFSQPGPIVFGGIGDFQALDGVTAHGIAHGTPHGMVAGVGAHGVMVGTAAGIALGILLGTQAGMAAGMLAGITHITDTTMAGEAIIIVLRHIPSVDSQVRAVVTQA
jgi:hypothetical protein